MTPSLPGRVYHLTENYSPVANTGPTEVIRQLSQYLVGQGWAATVLTAGAAAALAPDGVDLVEFPLVPISNIWRYPRNMAAYLRDHQDDLRNEGAVFHLHGVWGAPQWLGARIAARRGVPAVLTTYNMLSPWHWNKGRFNYLKKLIYWWTVAYPAFRHISVIHAITKREIEYLARLFRGKRLELIPNAVDLEEVDRLLARSEKEDALEGEGPYLLFLGRLDPQKGVDILLEAFAQSAKGRNFRLAVIGSEGKSDYTDRLRFLIKELGLDNRVTFLGPVFGLKKWRLYQDAWAGCLPSRSDSISIASLEFASASIPTVTTHESGLHDWEEGGGLLVNPKVEEVTRALDQVFSWTEEERRQRGRRLRRLVERRYSWQAVGPLWLELYSKMLAL
jgi:poly(glycerol-phosphate) alpha-glucosyltransferase